MERGKEGRIDWDNGVKEERKEEKEREGERRRDGVREGREK